MDGRDSSFSLTWPYLELVEFEAAAQALGTLLDPGTIVFLRGPMGTGKTAWVRAMARGLGIARAERVSSPTYTLSQVHRGRIDLLHVDLHRLGDQQADHREGRRAALSAGFEALDLEQLREGYAGRSPVVAIEWPEFWGEYPERIDLELSYAGADFSARSVTVSAYGMQADACVRAWCEQMGPTCGTLQS